jgi:hypothetical protein
MKEECMRTSVLFIAFWSVANTASGALLYDSGVTSTASYTVSDASPGADQLFADDFLLTDLDYTIERITWRGTYARGESPQADNFTILIHRDQGGAPDSAALFVYESVSTSRSGPDAKYVFSYNADIPDTALEAGARYWLSIFQVLPVDLRWAWIYQFEGGDSDERSYYRQEVGEPYSLAIPYRTDFQLLGTSAVPEPSSRALLVAGLTLGVALHQFLRRSAALS